MSHFSPATILLWAILAVLTFLITHLWKFDRFQCLRWNAGKQPGAFTRVMTYTYLATMPLLVFYSIAMTVLKYREGYVALPPADMLRGTQNVSGKVVLETGTIIPKPFELWDATSRAFVFPLQLVFAIAWSFEMVTHFEEFNFWVFLINQGEKQRTWFRSREFQWWLLGSLCAVVAMPLTAVLTRHDLLLCEAWIFFIGSIGSTSITVMFLYVLGRFPAFLRSVRAGGAPPAVVVRLRSFHEINIIRVGFRFMFTIPFLILAIDGIRSSPNHPINQNIPATDLLSALGGVGCLVSSALTLLVFFPRSQTEEAGYNAREPTYSFGKRTHSGGTSSTRRTHDPPPPFEPVDPALPSPTDESVPHHLHFDTSEEEAVTPSPPFQDSTEGVPMQEMVPPAAESAYSRPRRRRPVSENLNPLIAQYTSPINFVDVPRSSRRGPESNNAV